MGEEALFPCENCGEFWTQDGLVDVWFRRDSDAVTTLCFYCLGHAIRCTHARSNPKRCAYCWKQNHEEDLREEE
jgi:hypothetical protein